MVHLLTTSDCMDTNVYGYTITGLTEKEEFIAQEVPIHSTSFLLAYIKETCAVCLHNGV